MAGLVGTRVASEQQRQCPHCGSDDVAFTQRGLTGPTDAHDQFYTCRGCGRVTYEIVSRTPREIRIGRLEAGRQFRHEGEQYTVSRVLKVGLNESLVYVKPAPSPAAAAPLATRLPPRRR